MDSHASRIRPGVRMGVDVGEVRVGLAASDPAGMLAFPVQTLDRDLATGSDLDLVAEMAAGRAVVEVIVGLPRSLSGVEGVAAQHARRYAAELHRRLASVPVRLWDERLSTVDGHRVLRESGVPGRQQRAKIDQAAAVLILQSALDAERHTGRPPGTALRERKPRTPGSGRTDEGRQA